VVVLAWLAALAVAAATAAVGGMASDEARARLEQLPVLLLKAAIRRLPPEIRTDVGEEWRAELDHILHRFDAYPLTRLLCGIRFAAGLVRSALKISGDLAVVRSETPGQVQRKPLPDSLRTAVAATRASRVTGRFFLLDDEEAHWRGWQVTHGRAGLARTYRDPRFERRSK
jgi:hypothetical protein